MIRLAMLTLSGCGTACSPAGVAGRGIKCLGDEGSGPLLLFSSSASRFPACGQHSWSGLTREDFVVLWFKYANTVAVPADLLQSWLMMRRIDLVQF